MATAEQEAMRTALAEWLEPLGVSKPRIAAAADQLLASLREQGWALVSVAEAEGDAPGRRDG